MKNSVFAFFFAALLTVVCRAQQCEEDFSKEKFPEHWTDEPKYRMKDCVYLPEPYGTGSSTIREWILENTRVDREKKEAAKEE